MRELHKGFTENVFVTDIRSAEMIKYASNAFLPRRFPLLMRSPIFVKSGADVTEVAQGMGMDQRIGSSFLQAGIGYGGPVSRKTLMRSFKLRATSITNSNY